MRYIMMFFVILIAGQWGAGADDTIKSIERELQSTLDSLVQNSRIPGLTLAIHFNETDHLVLAAGHSEADKPMRPYARMFGGSTGKMYVSAIALDLISQDKLHLDTKISTYFNHTNWFEHLPNGDEITVRNLMQHTSGIPRYIFQESFLADLKTHPLKDRSPEQCIGHVLKMEAVHPVGKGFGYSDTNYLLLGLIIEKVSGKSYVSLLSDFLKMHDLKNTEPSQLDLANRIVQGHVSDNGLQLPAFSIIDNQYSINPTFEWTGGGTVTSSEDLAKLVFLLHTDQVLDSSAYQLMVSPVSQSTGQPHWEGYGLGTFVYNFDNSISYGHGGFFPGYQSHVEFMPDRQYAIAIQVNSDDFTIGLPQIVQGLKKKLLPFLDSLDQQNIRDNFSKQETCWNQQDLKCYMQAYAPKRMIQTASRGGITYGYEDILSNYQKYFPPGRMGTLHFDKMKLRKLTETFYHATGRFNLQFSGQEELTQGWFSVTMEKLEGKWYIITDHSS